MGFSNREYHLYVVLGDANMPPLWHWSLWQRVSAELDPIIAAAAGPVGVRSTQKSIIDGSQIRFGKISWSSKGHMKWTHGSPETLGTPKDSNFLHTEIWAPSRTASDKRAMPPDFLLAFQNEGYWVHRPSHSIRTSSWRPRPIWMSNGIGTWAPSSPSSRRWSILSSAPIN